LTLAWLILIGDSALRDGALILGETPEAPTKNSRLKCHGLAWVVASGFTLREPEHKDVSSGAGVLDVVSLAILDGYDWSPYFKGAT
jgi:hypothetical protein